MKKFLTIIEVCVVFLLSLTPIVWLRNGYVILGHDSGFRIDPFSYLVRVWSTWDAFAGFGTDLSNYKGFLIAQLPEAFFVRLTGSLSTGQTFSFIFWFFVIGMCMYVCVKSFFPYPEQWVARMLATVGYMYNLFLLQGWFITERAKFSLFAAIPLIVTIVWFTFKGRYAIFKGAILAGWTLFFLNGGGSPPLYGGLLVTIVVLCVTDIGIGIANRQGWYSFKRVAVTVAAMGVAIVWFNAYWIFPQFYVVLTEYGAKLSSLGGVESIAQWEKTVSVLASPLNLFRLQGIPDWYNNSLHPYAFLYQNPTAVALSFIPILLFVYILARRDLRRTFFSSSPLLTIVLVLWIVSMMFTAGSHPPFAILYKTLLTHIPGFAIFRSSFYKFGPAFWFSSIFLFSVSAYMILKKYIRHPNVYHSVGVAMVFGVLLYHHPYISTNFFLWNKPFTTKIHLPSHVTDMVSYINTRYVYEHPRILIMPALDSGFRADGYEWGFWGLDLFSRLSMNASTIANDREIPIVRAMYQAVGEGDMSAFRSLTKQSGITKILWRDDILYPDKQTIGKDFAYMKRMIETDSDISVEKQFGAWTLYSLGSTSDIEPVSIVGNIVRADAEAQEKGNVFLLGAVEGTPIVFSDDIPKGAAARANLKAMTAMTIQQALCVYCDSVGLDAIQYMVLSHQIKFLPDSPLYAFSKFKESRILGSVRSSPFAYIDANLGYATKHLVEIRAILKRGTSQTAGGLAEQSFRDFRRKIEGAISVLPKLNEIERNTQKLRIAAYLRFYIYNLSQGETAEGRELVSLTFFTNAYQYIKQQIAAVSTDIWVSDAMMKRYYLSTATSGRYLFDMPPGERFDAVEVAGTTAKLEQPVQLPAGIHKVAIASLPIDLTSTASSTESAGISLPYSIEVKGVSGQTAYTFHMVYEVTAGRNIYAVLRQNNDVLGQYGNPQRALTVQLESDGKRHTIDRRMYSNSGVSRADLDVFSSVSFDEVGLLRIYNLSFAPMNSPHLFARTPMTASRVSLPAISSQQTGAGSYQAVVKDAVSPLVVALNEQFDQGWRAYLVPEGKPIGSILFMRPLSSAVHFMLNGYANAWHIDTQGSYTLVFVYWPHIIFLFSFLISSFGLLGSIGFALWRVVRIKHL